MGKARYVFNQMHELYHLAIRELDMEGNLMEQPYHGLEKQDPVLNDKSLFNGITSVILHGLSNCYVYHDVDFAYSVFQVKQSFVIIGPVAQNVKSSEENQIYLVKHKVSSPTLMIPQMSLMYLKKITGFVYGLLAEDYDGKNILFGDYEIEENLIKDQVIKECLSNEHDTKDSMLEEHLSEQNKKHATIQEEINQELTEYVLDITEQEQYHFSFEEEKKQAEHIIQGESRRIVHSSGENTVFSKKFIGKMAKTPFKQVEYECVCWITLMTRYAIEAGVSDAKSYALSDVTLQKLSVATTTVEMEHIFDTSMKEFDTLIQEAKALKCKHSPYIEQCKDYIAKHIYEKITLEAIADEVGLHPVYLSHLFSETIGMPITSFIAQEKIKISCNMLKYSGKSIAEVAEYMNLAPQSYYTRVFKKVMDQSPAQYRKEHLDKKFYNT